MKFLNGILGVLCLVGNSAVFATDYYVDTTNVSDLRSTTQAAVLPMNQQSLAYNRS